MPAENGQAAPVPRQHQLASLTSQAPAETRLRLGLGLGLPVGFVIWSGSRVSPPLPFSVLHFRLLFFSNG